MSKEIVLLKKDEVTHAEVVMPSEELLARIVNDRYAALLTEAQTAELQPFFERREVTQAMLRTADVLEKHKWNWRWARFGCLICQRKEPVVHNAGLSMCERCLSRTREQLSSVKREHAPDVAKQEFKNSVRLAREAVLPSIGNLSRKRGAK